MKEVQKINLITLLTKHISYKDGFWVLDNEIVSEDFIRKYIKQQGIPILEKDITDVLSELGYTDSCFDIDKYFVEKIKKKAKEGKSKYFESMDKLYPNNKFREIMNYYLFSDDCYSFIFIGYGQTGKTTFVSLISKIIGEKFFGRSNVALIRNNHGTAILEGKKLFEVAEAQDLDLDTANTLKSMITNDTIYINPKFQLPRTFKPHIKLIMTCNNMPKFKVTDDGIIRRFITIKMDQKIEKQNKRFLDEIEEDIPFIIYESLQHPFKIEDFAVEQYAIFETDAQWGFGYGIKNLSYNGETEYEKYVNMCKALGYGHRNFANFNKFIELEKIYKGRIKCDTILNESTEQIGISLLTPLEIDDLPF